MLLERHRPDQHKRSEIKNKNTSDKEQIDPRKNRKDPKRLMIHH